MGRLYKGFPAAESASTPVTPISALQVVPDVQVHITRRKAMASSHPEIQDLMRPRPDSALYVLGCVGLQIVIAALMNAYAAPWWVIGAVAYCVGAVADHALWVLIHDLTHDAVFPSTFWNNVFHLVANLPIVFPSAISFKYFHQMHHAKLGEVYGDPDMPAPIENAVFGTSALGKAAWLLMFALIQSVRTVRYEPKLGGLEKWAVANWVIQLGFNYAVWHYTGWTGLAYMTVSSIFAIGLHPLGARWIAEHYAVKEPQETYSYYGSANIVALNVGYHNEHHDWPTVPWQHLPLVRAAAPEFYNNLWYHTSYFSLLWDFITNPAFTLESRVVRLPKGKTAPSYLKNDSIVIPPSVIESARAYAAKAKGGAPAATTAKQEEAEEGVDEVATPAAPASPPSSRRSVPSTRRSFTPERKKAQ